jgi:hypothetical protein
MDAIALKDLDLAIIQPDGDGDDITSCRSPESPVNGRIQLDAFSNHIKLADGNVQRIIFVTHFFSPFQSYPKRSIQLAAGRGQQAETNQFITIDIICQLPAVSCGLSIGDARCDSFSWIG